MNKFTRTEPADNYIQPTNEEVMSMAVRVGLTTYSPDFVRDIANVISGGRVRTSSEYREELLESIPEPEVDYQGYFQYQTSYGYTHTTESRDYAAKENLKYNLKASREYL